MHESIAGSRARANEATSGGLKPPFFWSAISNRRSLMLNSASARATVRGEKLFHLPFIRSSRSRAIVSKPRSGGLKPPFFLVGDFKSPLLDA
jgi:hypothetical protein